MFDFKMVNVDSRKKEIIDALGLKGANEAIADLCCPKQDRVMIADFVIAAVEKAMETVKLHINATAPLLSKVDSMEAYVAATIHELSNTMDGIMHHMHAEAMSHIMEQDPAEAIRRMMEGAFGGAGGPRVVVVGPDDDLQEIIRQHLAEGPQDKDAEEFRKERDGG